ncbi:hypothetical protein [Haloplanus vescus]|uniref:hypothetical protein n=1 Tax=Haloplanus vescus TaxID=555874 RepID=UPI00115FFC21|nr:hypothetical protein [Haloplanus vescus]
MIDEIKEYASVGAETTLIIAIENDAVRSKAPEDSDKFDLGEEILEYTDAFTGTVKTETGIRESYGEDGWCIYVDPRTILAELAHEYDGKVARWAIGEVLELNHKGHTVRNVENVRESDPDDSIDIDTAVGPSIANKTTTDDRS